MTTTTDSPPTEAHPLEDDLALEAALDEHELDEPAEPAVRYVDPVSLLTLRELDLASRQLKCDVMLACQTGHYLRPAALPLVAWLHARREQPTVKLEQFRAMTLLELEPHLTFTEPAGALEAAGVDDDPAELAQAGGASHPASPTPPPA